MRVLSKQEIKDLNIQLTEDCQLVEKIPHNPFVMESLLLCIASRKLYNTGLYQFRQQYIKNGTCLTYETLAKQLKHNSHFQSLLAKVSQQTLKMLSQDIKSFFALKQSDKLTEEEKRRIKLPQYKQYFSPVIYTQQALYKQTYTKKGLIHLSGTDIQFKSNLDFNQICQVRIVPLRKNKIESFMLSEHDFRIEVVYNADLTKLKNNTAVKLHKKLIENISSKGKEYIKEEIDSIKINTQAQHFIGIDQNLDGLVTSNSHAYSLKPIKSVNHYWNKSVSILKSEIASIEAILSNSEKKQILTDYSTDCLKNTIHKLRNKIRKITRYRNNFVENYVHQLSNQFINQLSEKVQLIIYGKNVNFKKEINLGKITNQNFVQIPFNKIIEKNKL